MDVVPGVEDDEVMFESMDFFACGECDDVELYSPIIRSGEPTLASRGGLSIGRAYC